MADEDAFLDSLMAFAAQGLPPLADASGGTSARGMDARVTEAGGTDDGEHSTASSSPARGQSDQELARQEKARVKYRRIYHMRQARRQTLRAQVAALEAELAALSSQHGRPHERALPYASPPAGERLEREHALRELAMVKLQIKRDNAELRRRLHAHEAAAERMRDELFAEHRLWVACSTSFTMLKRLTVPESLAIRARALDTLEGVRAAAGALTRVGTVCGWEERRSVHLRTIRFMLRKTFYRYTPEDVSSRLFAIMSDPRQIVKLYKSSMDVAFHFVQRVSDDCVMLLMEMASLPGHDAKITTIPLVSRRKIATGYQILIQPLLVDGFPMKNDMPMDSVRVGDPPPSESGLNEHCFAMLLEEAGAGGADCRASFVGVAQAVESHTFFWLIEELLHCVRAEELMFGPRFSLPRTRDAAVPV